MTDDLNPQREQMADESMVRTLSAQADAIWPQEQHLFRRYALESAIEILDAGCGTGEISLRLAEFYPEARVLGVDVLEEHLERARVRCAAFADRVHFEARSVYDLELPERRFDLTVCRHVVQAIPLAGKVLAELVRVTKSGGRLHVIAEDYGMLHFPVRRTDPGEFWHTAPRQFGHSLGTDFHIGRNIYGLLVGLGLSEIAIDYVIVDTLRVPRETFVAIIDSWREGYADIVSQHTSMPRATVVEYFEDMLDTLRDETSYAVWMVPVATARVP